MELVNYFELKINIPLANNSDMHLCTPMYTHVHSLSSYAFICAHIHYAFMYPLYTYVHPYTLMCTHIHSHVHPCVLSIHLCTLTYNASTTMQYNPLTPLQMSMFYYLDSASKSDDLIQKLYTMDLRALRHYSYAIQKTFHSWA